MKCKQCDGEIGDTGGVYDQSVAAVPAARVGEPYMRHLCSQCIAAGYKFDVRDGRIRMAAEPKPPR